MSHGGGHPPPKPLKHDASARPGGLRARLRARVRLPRRLGRNRLGLGVPEAEMMGRTVGQPDEPDQEAGVSAPLEAERDGQGIRPHVASPDCWCCPIEDEPGVWIHQTVTQTGH